MRPGIALSLASILAAALFVALPSASAQPPTFTQAYQVRGAVGDIPTTTPVEPAGSWNLEQRLAITFTNTTPATHLFSLPAGAKLLNASCTCNPSHYTATADTLTFTIDTGVPTGSYVLTVLTSQPNAQAFAFSLNMPVQTTPTDRVAILYVPAGQSFDAPVKPSTGPLTSTDGTSSIVVFTGLGDTFWASIHPAAVTAAQAGSSSPMMTWLLALAAGLVLGALLWAVLVSRGAVQRKGRKQVATTAAHVEAAANESPAVLEGRKRALLAALKEVEVAKMNNEMPAEVYDVVKADLKRQAVTVMRALEAGTAEPKA